MFHFGFCATFLRFLLFPGFSTIIIVTTVLLSQASPVLFLLCFQISYNFSFPGVHKDGQEIDATSSLTFLLRVSCILQIVGNIILNKQLRIFNIFWNHNHLSCAFEILDIWTMLGIGFGFLVTHIAVAILCCLGNRRRSMR